MHELTNNSTELIETAWPLQKCLDMVCVYQNMVLQYITVWFNIQVSKITLFIIEVESDINATASVSESQINSSFGLKKATFFSSTHSVIPFSDYHRSYNDEVCYNPKSGYFACLYPHIAIITANTNLCMAQSMNIQNEMIIISRTA